MTTHRLAGIAEIADLLGVTKQTAIKYAGRADFPKPLDRLATGPVWRRRDVEAWAKRTLPLPAGRPRSRDRTPDEIADVVGEALALREQRARGQAGRPRGPREPRP